MKCCCCVQSVGQREKTTSRRFIVFITALIFAISFGGVLFAQATLPANTAITAFDAPDANQAMYSGTVALAIDQAGDVAGVYEDANKAFHAYVRSASGKMSEFDGPTGNGEPQATIPIGFDTAGDLAGIYVDGAGSVHGFLRSAAGTVTSIDVPYSGPAEAGSVGYTIPTFIDAAGDVAGVYTDANEVPHGFVLPAGGKITTIPDPVSFSGPGATVPGVVYVTESQAGVAGTFVDVQGAIHGFVVPTGGGMVIIDAPGASTGVVVASVEAGTAITAIDNSGNVGGLYLDSNSLAHGFVRSASGAFSTFDAPTTGASRGIFPFSYPFQFDTAGDLTGVYLDGNDVAHEFVRSSNGTISYFDAPDASPMPISMQKRLARITQHTKIGSRLQTFAHKRFGNVKAFKGNVLKEASLGGNLPSGVSQIQGTLGFAISPAGTITGVYTDGEAGIHSFVRSSDGTITEFNAPDAGTGVYQGTLSFAVNASGTVAGSYLDSDSVVHGFVASLGQGAPTTTTLTAKPTTAVYGQPVTLTAQVRSGSAALPDGTTIQFRSGTTEIGRATTSSGVATSTITDLSVGSDTITAIFAGDVNYAGSTSAPVTVTVGPTTSSTRLSSSLNPATAGQSVTFTALVTGGYGGTATGTVAFSDGSTSLGSVPLSGNAASFTTSSLASGTHCIIAAYSGDLNFRGSTSDLLSETVDAATSSCAPVINTLTPAFVVAGGPTFTLTVNGWSFSRTSTVYWGSTALTTTYVNATQLTTQVPAASIGSAGTSKLPGFSESFWG